MPTIDAFCEHSQPITPDTLCSEAFARFDNEPDALLLAVVEDGRPIGVVERDPFLRKLASENGRTLYGNRPVSTLMDVEPVVVDGTIALSALTETLLSQSAHNVLRGFIVTSQGRYQGVGTLVRLLQAGGRRDAEAEHLKAEVETIRSEARQAVEAAARAKSGFLTLLSRELRTPMNGVAAVADMVASLAEGVRGARQAAG